MTWKPPAGTNILKDLRDTMAKFEQQHTDWLRSCQSSGIEIVPDASVAGPTLHVPLKDYESLVELTTYYGPEFCCPDCHLPMLRSKLLSRCARCGLMWTSNCGFFG